MSALFNIILGAHFAAVSFLVESHEENEVLNSSECKHDGGSSGVITREDERLEGMEKHEDKLDKLESCKVLLPPKIFLNFRTTSCKQVIEIHNSMNSRV